VDASGGGIKHLVDRFRAHDRRGKAAALPNTSGEIPSPRDGNSPSNPRTVHPLARRDRPRHRSLARYLDANHKEERKRRRPRRCCWLRESAETPPPRLRFGDREGERVIHLRCCMWREMNVRVFRGLCLIVYDCKASGLSFGVK
jgi:hypothetical protein